MAQLTETLVRDILENGAGVTRWEVEQLCHAWLSAQTGEAVGWEWGIAGSNSWVRCDEETYRHVMKTGFFGHDSPPCVARALYTHPPAADFRAVVEALRNVVCAAEWWANNKDSPKSALSHFTRAAEQARITLASVAGNGRDYE